MVELCDACKKNVLEAQINKLNKIKTRLETKINLLTAEKLAVQ